MLETFSNSQLWTVLFSGIAALVASVAPILVAKVQAKQAAQQRAAEVKEAAVKAAAELHKAAEDARQQVKSAARKDAIAEWQNLYAEKQREACELRSHIADLQAQNGNQQVQLDILKGQHADCEEKHAILEARLAKVETNVNGGSHQ